MHLLGTHLVGISSAPERRQTSDFGPNHHTAA